MRISAVIKIPEAAKRLGQLFEAEKTTSKNGRAEYRTEKREEDFIIHITANDSTAFRAITNSLAKLLSVYEKMQMMVKNEHRPKNTGKDKSHTCI